MAVPYEGLKLLNDIKVDFPSQPTHIDFVFCEHDSAMSYPQKFSEIVSRSNFVALETVNNAGDTTELRQAVANGDTEALKQLSRLMDLSPVSGFLRKVNKSLLGTNVVIHYPEAPQNHPAAKAYMEAIEEEQLNVPLWNAQINAGNEGFTPSQMVPTLEKLMKAQMMRDRYTLEHFFPGEALSSDTPISYGVLFGLAHKGLASVIARQARLQGRQDITIATFESGTVDVSVCEKFLSGYKLTAEDAARYFRLGQLL